ncbi:hypothetical protein [Cryptosporangium arvum]|uniref:Uncharacterized protein n=1 Tax=Cryptosporangium arvum DSM 44712 TaxID=927661 RepID=A0A010ZMZ7_9ACTN|nr:hypothetical protein [Cryptosporangium arvum]EXG80064.1 hypothetical protein CryarDRAFT_1128 [Cryptosporangium arvum DSM 44712]
MTEPSGEWTALERRVSVLEERMDVESGFRIGIERDLDKITQRQVAQGQLLQALALTQSEHTERLSRIETKLGSYETRMGALEMKVGALEMKVGSLEGGVNRIIGMLDTLISREN